MLNPQFITVDDFNNYWGVNLRDKLRSVDNNSDAAESFLWRVEDRLMNWIDSNTFRNIRYCDLSPKQLDNFKKAILTQAMYTWKNGDLGMDSGYDQEAGLVAKRSDLIHLQVCQAAMDYLKNAGLFNLVMKNRIRHFGTGDFR